MLKTSLMATTLLVLTSALASAGPAPSAEEMAKIEATLKAWGCSATAAEVESEGSGLYEMDDAKCADGKIYDIRLNQDFSVHTISAN
ncbi:hypothetical protein [Aestuariivirga sp.]|jgi:hypothetical protein|uniref:hypothetical protein n=1 Tax=Aestuariivirga sp. TaxID=2650926 RepID=UPI003784A63F